MNAAALLIILLSNHGYWFGGQEGTITIREAARGGLPAADLSWELSLSNIRIGNGGLALNPHDADTVLKIVVPACRERISLRWTYRIVEHATGRELDRGEIPLQVFSNDLLSGLAEQMGRKHLLVWDRPQGIPKLLDSAKIPYTRMDSESTLQFAHSDVVLVGKNMIDSSAFAQMPLKNLVEAGSPVMVFEQNKPDRLMGYNLSRRKAPADLEWRMGHPLLRDLSAADVRSWTDAALPVWVVQLPANEPALELAYYPPEAPTSRPGPIDAMLLTKSMGAGKLVLCQIPLGDWAGDPRSQIFLRNAIDYLVTRPQPTPWPSDRPMDRAVQLPRIATIPLSTRGHQ
jgi:hypothetical protein